MDAMIDARSLSLTSGSCQFIGMLACAVLETCTLRPRVARIVSRERLTDVWGLGMLWWVVSRWIACAVLCYVVD